MAKLTFEVEVTGAVEGWELALLTQETMNEYFKKGNRGIFLERVEAVDFGSFHCATCDCDNE